MGKEFSAEATCLIIVLYSLVGHLLFLSGFLQSFPLYHWRSEVWSECIVFLCLWLGGRHYWLWWWWWSLFVWFWFPLSIPLTLFSSIPTHMGHTFYAAYLTAGFIIFSPISSRASPLCVRLEVSLGFVIAVSFPRAPIKEFVNMPCLEPPPFITVEHCSLASLVSLLSDQLGLPGPQQNQLWFSPLSGTPERQAVKNKTLKVSKTVLFCSPCWRHEGIFFSSLPYTDLVEPLEVKLTKARLFPQPELSHGTELPVCQAPFWSSSWWRSLPQQAKILYLCLPVSPFWETAFCSVGSALCCVRRDCCLSCVQLCVNTYRCAWVDKALTAERSLETWAWDSLWSGGSDCHSPSFTTAEASVSCCGLSSSLLMCFELLRSLGELL